MTLEGAVRVLNERKHNGIDDWTSYERYDKPVVAPWKIWRDECLTPFEAIAVAEKYVREAEMETPCKT